MIAYNRKEMRKMFQVNIEKLSPELQQMVRELSGILDFEFHKDGVILEANIQSGAKELSVTLAGETAQIVAPKKVLFARGLGLLKELLEEKKEASVVEKIRYDQLEAMVDCARNAVPTVKGLKRFIQHAALMGYTGLQLYLEDVFQMEKYPYFGYLRGAYAKEELKTLDDYCDSLGIELIPNIQTLAHLGRALKWNCFSEITDFDDILLVGEEKTYDFIEEMIKTMSESIRSRRIHVGMDEAHMLGFGRYFEKYGYTDRMTLMIQHLARVKEITDKYGYSIMMWSDMFFDILNNGSYREAATGSDEAYHELKKKIPQGVELIYWNYYTDDKKVYDTMFDSHNKMSDKIGFAAGAWRWTSLTPYNTFSLHVDKPAHISCEEKNIRHVIVTAWGDDGGEVSLFAVLPSFQYWAEACYSLNTPEEVIGKRFQTCTKGDLHDFLVMDEVLVTPENPPYTHVGASPSKYLLYQDVLYGMFDKHVSPLDKQHFLNVSGKLETAAQRNPEWAILFEVQKSLADLLSEKVDCGILLREAYKKGDKETLKKYCETTIPSLLERVDCFAKTYSKQWLAENKAFGLDMFDIRIGGLKERLLRCKSRLESYLNGEVSQLEELEQDILYFDCRDEKNQAQPLVAREYFWRNIATTSSACTTMSY